MGAPHCIRTVVVGMLVVGMLADGMPEVGTLTKPQTRQMMTRQMSLRHLAPSRKLTQSQPGRVGTMTPACTRPSSIGVHLSVGCTTSATSAIDTLELGAAELVGATACAAPHCIPIDVVGADVMLLRL